MAEEEESTEATKKNNETTKKGIEAGEKAGIKATGATLGPKGAAAAKVVAEVPFFRKILEGGLLGVALFILAFIALIIIAIIALISVLGPNGFSGRPAISGNPNAGGGYIIDSAFPATKNLSSSEVMNKLSRYENLKGKQSQVQMIIDKSRAAGINYYLLLDIWVAEQSFGNDAAAMGCGVYGGANRASGFENQVDCAIGTIKKTLNNIEPYNQPTGQNNFTRLFYNYTEGMQERYKKVGYVAECNDNRLILHRILAPEEVVCQTEGTGPGLALVGDKLYPPLGAKMGSYLTYSGHSTWCCGLCTTCAVDYAASGGTPIYALADGKVRGLHPYTSKGGQYRGYTFFFFSNDGVVYATYAHLNPAGSLKASDVGLGKDVFVKKGDLLGVVYPGLNHPHLHFELKINNQTVGMTGIGGVNNQLLYFGKLFY